MFRARAPVLLAALVALVLAASPFAARADALAPHVAEAFELREVTKGIELVTAIEFLPDGRLVIAEKTGRVLVRRPTGELHVAGKLDVDAKTEKGLLNVIKHPAFAATRDLIFYYSAASAPELDKHKIALIRLTEQDQLDLAGERVLVRGLRGPDDHEMGGGLAIDRTGKLLVGVGDTGCRARKLPEPPYAPANYFGTCLTNGNGKILRIGLDGSIPADNPLVDVKEATTCGAACGDDPFGLALGEPRRDIWAWGMRNPWRIWVDPKTGSTWVGDVGDLANEEIDVVPPGGGKHYGWPWREGAAGHPVSACERTVPNRGPCVEPAYTCKHDDTPGEFDPGCKSINGGLIVDDCRWPDAFRGRYYFGDNANGRIWSLEPTAARDGVVPGSRRDVGQLNGFVVDLDVGPDAGLYLAVMRIPPEESVVFRMAPRVPGRCAADGTPLLREVPGPRPGAEEAGGESPMSTGRKVAGGAVLAALLVAALVVALELRDG
jgi:glucose/arabinose dehydrogenase